LGRRRRWCDLLLLLCWRRRGVEQGGGDVCWWWWWGKVQGEGVFMVVELRVSGSGGASWPTYRRLTRLGS
jgi:hypothetical protein